MRELAEHRQLQSSLQEAKAELEDAKNLLQSVVDTAPVRIFWKDKQLNYLGCNPIFAQDAGKQAPAR
jgi:PAS domain-containing protein